MIHWRHKYEVEAAQQLGAVNPRTVILWRCKCGKVKTEVINGHWTIHQIRGEQNPVVQSGVAT